MSADTPDGMNVMFITFDQLRRDALRCLGNPLVSTPHFDAVAADGTLFANHFANTCPCGPCSPGHQRLKITLTPPVNFTCDSL